MPAAILLLLALAAQDAAKGKAPPAGADSPNLVRILVIDGQPKTKYFSDETAYLMAFFDVVRAKDDVRHRYKIVRQTKLRLSKEVIQVLDMVYLCNVHTITEKQAGLLEALVRRGGAVIITAGNKIHPDLYNKLLYRDGKGILPGRLGDHVFLEDARPRFRKGAAASINYSRKSLPRFQRAYAVEIKKTPQTEVIATVADKPLLVVKKLGRGRCILFSSTIDLGWNKLAVHPLFVTTMLEIIEYAKGTTIPRKRTGKNKDKS